MKSVRRMYSEKKKRDSSSVVCLCLANGKFAINLIFSASRNREIPNRGKNLFLGRTITTSKANRERKSTTYL